MVRIELPSLLHHAADGEGSPCVEARTLLRSAPFVVLAMALLIPLLIGLGRLVAGE